MATNKVTNAQIVQALANEGNIPFKGTDFSKINLAEFFNTASKRDLLIHALMEVISLQTISTSYFENPLKEYKLADLKSGMEREVFVNMIKARNFDFYKFANPDELFKIYNDNTMAINHRVNAHVQFPTTVSYNELRDAFTDTYGIQTLIDEKIGVLYPSAELWEYQNSRDLLNNAFSAGLMFPVHVKNPTTKEEAEDILMRIQECIESSRFPNPLTNYTGSDSVATKNDITVFLTPRLKSLLDVKTLAQLFHIDYAEVPSKVKVIDKINPDCVCYIVDNRFLHIRNQLLEMTSNFNAANMSWNYFLNVWEMFSLSLFRTAIAFTTLDIGGYSDNSTILFTNSIETAVKGNEYNLEAKIVANGGEYVPNLIDYDIITTGTSPCTVFVPGTSILLIDKNEKLDSITVRATSRLDSSLNVTQTINLTD